MLAKRWGNPSVHGQVMDDTMRSIHTVEYHSALKRMDVLIPAQCGLNREDIMLSDMRQTHKDMSCVIPLTGGPGGVRFRDREWMVEPETAGGE